jgi:hypothetical protein
MTRSGRQDRRTVWPSDVAVNNAGTEGQGGPIADQTAESYAATFDRMFSA